MCCTYLFGPDSTIINYHNIYQNEIQVRETEQLQYNRLTYIRPIPLISHIRPSYNFHISCKTQAFARIVP